MIQEFEGKKPQIANNVFLAPGSKLIGEVVLEEGVSIWHNTILRADLAPIHIGSKTNIQENSSLHVDQHQPLIIGKNVTVGHGAIVHACTIEDNCLIGMGAIILSGAKIGEGSIIGAGALIAENKEIPPHSLVLGVPGKIIRAISQAEVDELIAHAQEYYNLAQRYLQAEKNSH